MSIVYYPTTPAAANAGLEFPHIAASSSVSQYAAAANTPTRVTWNTLESAKGFTLDPGNYAIAAYTGIYKISYGLQASNNSNAIHFLNVWLKVNNVDVDYSGVEFTLSARKSAGEPYSLLAYSSIVFPMNAGDYVDLWWASDQTATSGGALGVYLEAQPAITTPYIRPSTPSVIGDIAFVSAV